MWGLAILPFILLISLFFLFIPIVISVFVYKDAESRGMNGLIWALIVIFVPSYIGLIIYFVVRENEGAYECANCHASVKANQDYCPKCGASLQSRYDLNQVDGRQEREGRTRRENVQGKLSPLVILLIVLVIGMLLLFMLFGFFSMRQSRFPDFMMRRL